MQGLVFSQTFTNTVFRDEPFHAVTFKQCDFSNVRFIGCPGYYVVFQDCKIDGLFLERSQWSHVKFSRSIVERSTLPAAMLGAIESSRLNDVILAGAVHNQYSKALLCGSCINGVVKNLVLVENKKLSQFRNVDLRECQISKLKLIGVDVNKGVLPAAVSHAIVPDWHLVAEDIANSARELTSKYSEGSPQFLAGHRVFQAVQHDAELYRLARNINRESSETLGLDENRGGRLAHELISGYDPEIQAYVEELYGPFLTQV